MGTVPVLGKRFRKRGQLNAVEQAFLRADAAQAALRCALQRIFRLAEGSEGEGFAGDAYRCAEQQSVWHCGLLRCMAELQRARGARVYDDYGSGNRSYGAMAA
ncbi:hypothetical protein D3C84_1112520 [compost metagenome]